MKSDEILTELENQIRSNRPLIYITTHEEHRVKDAIQQIACTQAPSWSYVFWDIAAGALTNSNRFKAADLINQTEILDWFSELKVDNDDFCILVLHDFYRFLAPDGHPGQLEITTIRSLKNLVEKCSSERKCVILTGPKFFMPTDFEKLVTVIDWPLPDRELILTKLKSLLDAAKNHPSLAKFETKYSTNELDKIIKAFQGLSLKEIEMICTYLILTDTRFDPQKISSKKQDIIKQSGILEWVNVEFNLDQVGGLDNLKRWLIKRKDAFSARAKEYGLPENPKGLLIIGVQGAGKSRISKAIATFWYLPLLRLDVGRIFSGLVGSSEENLRNVIKTAESVAPCILWVDEIDKAFSNYSAYDSGTSARVFGSFLTWMQEKKSSVFVVATANMVQNLPAELVRKGRFDDIFFVDLPDDDERKEIIKIHLGQRNFDINGFDIDLLVKKSKSFTGAEIEAAIISAMYEGFSDNERPIKTVDIIKELEESVPICVTMKENIQELRSWASQRARNATYSKHGTKIHVESLNPNEEL